MVDIEQISDAQIYKHSSLYYVGLADSSGKRSASSAFGMITTFTSPPDSLNTPMEGG